ncbi:nicotinamide riboside kinase 1-like isoform X1 [Macrosteles quadrilineatus]|uniref:nicotinamide riboside kinase 1-like isoform X1 n=1 Tax=Macrosteles quadrilineatus TaxID=74068 RepID=UPI0023E10ABD|nr:nicotinamide riboside kinase 1-like isoform X1 [Macrosteles quadrilineatus]
MSEKKWTVVGVSGVTCGGKTTFAAALRAEFPDATVVSQDDYFLPPDDPRHTHLPELNHINWEIATALDMDRMVSDIREILTRNPGGALLILEGYLIFTDPFLSSLCDLKYFFTISPEECRNRRAERAKEPPDPSWASLWHDKPGYFENILWPEYERNLQVALNINSDLKFIDGTRTTQSVVNKVAEDVQQVIMKKVFAV